MRFLAPPEPILLEHIVTVDQPLGSNMQAFDVDVDLDDYSLKHKITSTLSYSAEAQTSISALDDEVSTLLLPFPPRLTACVEDYPGCPSCAEFQTEARLPYVIRGRFAEVHPDVGSIPGARP